jgi:nucleoside phosphorylase
VILWDEDTKRGWLVNGTSALLHLVRASLEHDSKDKFSSEFIFRSQDFQEPAPDASHKSDSAIGILLNHANRNLEIYREKDGYILFEDRVEHLFRILEQIMDHQVLVLSSYDPPYLAANVSRAYLEGWDFRDLASDLDPIYPRVATLSTPGMAWIEFTRSLKAVALLGQGFGEIMTPIHQRCRQWATLPIGQYNLAVSATDLMEIMDVVGDVGAIPPRLTERLVWYNSEDILLAAHCQCAGQDIDKHIDVVQVILPLYLADKFKTMQARQLGNGAVIFGYNKSIPWFWKETGDPVRGSPGSPDKPMFLFPLSDSGYGPSSEEGSDSTQPTSLQTPAPSDTSPPTSTLQVPLAAPKVKSKIQALSAYTVSIVCALPLELFAVRALFDVTHADGDGITTPSGDPNHYALGEIGKHKVVAACLPDGEYGTNSAADVAANMKRTFTSVKFVLLVGIGGGVPSPANDIRLGDVVVSRPTGNNPGVIQYDMGKILENGVFTQGGFLQPPPRLIMTALSNLRSDPHISRTPLRESLEEIAACKREYRYPGIHLDRLFTSEYPHDPAHETCDDCDMKRLQPRANRPDIQPNSHHPEIHYGTIASGNCVVRDAKFRDHWGTQNNESKILCFEMEAAGIVNTIPCLVIRGICDYSDTHKNKVFQNYAAAAAASYAKLLLSYVKDLRDLEGAVEERNMEGTKRFKSLCKAFSAKCRIQ